MNRVDRADENHRLRLRGDEGPTGKGMFVGDDCGMCMKPDVWSRASYGSKQDSIAGSPTKPPKMLHISPSSTLLV